MFSVTVCKKNSVTCRERSEVRGRIACKLRACLYREFQHGLVVTRMRRRAPKKLLGSGTLGFDAPEPFAVVRPSVFDAKGRAAMKPDRVGESQWVFTPSAGFPRGNGGRKTP